MSNGAIIIF